MEQIILERVQSRQEKPLTERVADKINQLIVEENLKPGDKLPNEFELMEQLNVGRGTVREAIKLLISRNVLEIQRGRGTFVAKNTGELDDPLGLAYMTDQFLISKELFEVREHTEPWIASLAAERASEEEIEELKKRCKEVETLISNGENHLDADKRFHEYIGQCAHNRIVSRILPIILYSVILFGKLNKRSLKQETVKTHREITEAIAHHDAKAASEAMHEHMAMNGKSIEALLTAEKNRKQS